MVQVGTIEYRAVVTGADDARDDADDVGDSFTQMGENAEVAAGSTGFLAGMLGTTDDALDDTSDEAEDTDTNFTLLAGTSWFLSRALGSLGVTAGSGILAGLAGRAAALRGALAGLTLSGVVGSVTGALSSLAGWFLAGSAGALTLAAGIGVALGLLGVWVLEVTGVMDKIEGLGRMLSTQLPGWARDGLIAVIGVFSAPLAILGGFIAGFVEGFTDGFNQARANGVGIMGAMWQGIVRGFHQGVSDAIAVFDILVGAFDRTFDRIMSASDAAVDWILSGFDTIQGAVIGGIQSAWNSTVPSTVRVPSVTIGGGTFMGQNVPQMTFGGGSIDLPQLQAGGTVTETGVAEVHEGEVVGQPKALLEAAGVAPAGGGGTTIDVDQISIDLSGDFDPTDVTRRDLDSLADRLVDRIGEKANRRSGIR